MRPVPFPAVAAAAWAAMAAQAAFGLPPDGFTLCPFRLLAGHACPGCGMGHAVVFAMRGDWAASWSAHPLGLPLLLVWSAWLFWGSLNIVRRRSFSEGFLPFLRLPSFAVAVLALFFAVYAVAASPLAGTWLKDGAPFAELRADGSGRVDHDAVSWKADGKTLTLDYGGGEIERVPYQLKGDALSVVVDGETVVLARKGGAKAKGSAGGSAPVKAAPNAAPKGRLAQLLLSSPWCHFRYNKVSGSTHQERVVFRADGTWSSGARGESYSSGAYGSVAGQSDSGSGGRWQAKGDSLLLGEGGGPLQDVGLKVSRNSNGYPILNADGKEYSQCR